MSEVACSARASPQRKPQRAGNGRVFDLTRLDITEIWQPFVKGILEDIDLVDKLEG